MNVQNEPKKSNGSSDSDRDNSFRHSKELAHQLIRHLGIHAARKTCTENQWSGVLAAIDQLHRLD
jgi:hypothetical protein